MATDIKFKTENEIALEQAIAWYDSGRKDREEFITLMVQLFEYVWAKGE